MHFPISLNSYHNFYITYEHYDLRKFVHMKYNHKHVIFQTWIQECISLLRIAHTSFSLNFGQHAQYSHNFENTYIDRIFTKAHYIPNFYQQTYPTYDSMGASDKNMQRGTTLVFGIDSSEP